MPRCVFINPAVVLGRMGNVSGILDGEEPGSHAHVQCATADLLGGRNNGGEGDGGVEEGGRAGGGVGIACHSTMQRVS